MALVSIGDNDVEHGGSGGHSYPSDSQAMIMTMMVLVLLMTLMMPYNDILGILIE